MVSSETEAKEENMKKKKRSKKKDQKPSESLWIDEFKKLGLKKNVA